MGRPTSLASALLASAVPILCAAALVWLLRQSAAREPEFVASAALLWVADRDASALVALDRELFEARRVPCAWPVAVGARADGGAWVVSAVDGYPRGAHELGCLGAGGEALGRWPLAAVVAFAVSGDDALVVEGETASERRVSRVNLARGPELLAPIADASAVAGTGKRVLVGTARGELWLFDVDARAVVGAREVAGEVAAIESGALADGGDSGERAAALGWWVLERQESLRLHALGPDLEPRWSRVLGADDAHLAPLGDGRVWVVDGADPVARRFAADGAQELEIELPLGTARGAVARPDGGVWIGVPGAVLAVDAAGALAPGQGGFEFVADLARIF